MAVAMGCIGMSRDDFERCTPVEFYEIWNQWVAQCRDRERSAWERTRVLIMYFIQPYTKKTLSAHDVLPLPWDTETGKAKKEDISREEFNKRFEAAKQRNGLK